MPAMTRPRLLDGLLRWIVVALVGCAAGEVPDRSTGANGLFVGVTTVLPNDRVVQLSSVYATHARAGALDCRDALVVRLGTEPGGAWRATGEWDPPEDDEVFADLIAVFEPSSDASGLASLVWSTDGTPTQLTHATSELVVHDGAFTHLHLQGRVCPLDQATCDATAPRAMAELFLDGAMALPAAERILPGRLSIRTASRSAGWTGTGETRSREPSSAAYSGSRSGVRCVIRVSTGINRNEPIA